MIKPVVNPRGAVLSLSKANKPGRKDEVDPEIYNALKEAFKGKPVIKFITDERIKSLRNIIAPGKPIPVNLIRRLGDGWAMTKPPIYPYYQNAIAFELQKSDKEFTNQTLVIDSFSGEVLLVSEIEIPHGQDGVDLRSHTLTMTNCLAP